VDGFVGSYLKELDKAASEAASVPLSEVLPEYPPDADENWGLNPPVPPLGIERTPQRSLIDVLDELNDQTRVITVLTLLRF